MDNVVEIVVRSKNETKVGFDAARVDASHLGDDVGETFSKRFADKIINLRARIKTSIDKSGDEIGDSFGETIHKRITEKLKVAFSGGRQKVDVDVDVNKQTFLQRMTGLGKEGGDKLSDGLGGSLQSFFGGDFITLLLKVLGGGALVSALAPVLGAAISAAVLLAVGGGVLGVGIAGAFKDPQILGAANDLKTKLGQVFVDFGEPFRGPVADFLEKFSHFLDTSKPQLQAISDAFAPIASELGTAFISLLQNAMPGIADAAKGAKPLFDVLAEHGPAIGQAIGDFFRDIGDNGPAAAALLDDLLTVFETLLPLIGDLITGLGNIYLNVRDSVKRIVGSWRGLKDSIEDITSDMVGFVLRQVRKIAAPFTTAAASIRSAFSQAAGYVIGVINAIKSAIASVSFDGLRSRAQAAWDWVTDHLHHAAGGVVGSATGGIRSGLSWVGEQGPELVSLPAGATVHSAGDSQRMMQGGGGQMAPIVIQLIADGKQLAEVVVDPIRGLVRQLGAGSVQQFLGQPGRA